VSTLSGTTVGNSAGSASSASPSSSSSSPSSSAEDARARLDQRYGRRPPRPGRRRLLVAAVAAFAVAAAAWAVWAAVTSAGASLSWQDTGRDARDPAAVRVSFAVSAAAGSRVVCAVRATDDRGAVVGWLDVPLVVGSSGRATVTATVPTSQPATGGGVSACARR
jgi:hypothetical protein